VCQILPGKHKNMLKLFTCIMNVCRLEDYDMSSCRTFSNREIILKIDELVISTYV